MTTLVSRHLPPNPAEAAIAKSASLELARHAKQHRPLMLRVRESGLEQTIELPAGAVALLLEVLGAMAEGRGVTVIPENAELTTVEAAEMLNVSRTFLIKLLDEQAIPHHKVGSHRRIRMEDLMRYKQKNASDRSAILDELVQEAQEEDMGYRKQ